MGLFKLLFIILPCLVFSIQEAKYVQTTVFFEPKTCQKNGFYNHIYSSKFSSFIACSSQCSTTKDCRRIMFDRKTKLCSMFESGENCFSYENVKDKICLRQKSVCSEQTCIRCPIGYYGDTCQYIFQDCSHGFQIGAPPKNLLTYIQPSSTDLIIEVQCLFQYQGLTSLLRRFIGCREVDFNRSWSEYENGFGYKHGEYWLGLKHLYNILQNYPEFEINILIDYGNVKLQGYYTQFSLTRAHQGYKFSSGFRDHTKYPVGDSLTNGSYSIQGRPFSTYDRDYSNNNCPDRFKGGWWYLDDPVCSRANLNGRRNNSEFEGTIHWSGDVERSRTIEDIKLRVRRK